VASVVNEFHQVGAKMVADICELRGWDSYFLGANTPLDDLIRLVDNKKPDLLGLSVSIYFSMPGLLKVLDSVRAHYPRLEIIVGGQAFKWGGSEAIRKFPHVSYVASLAEVETLIAGK
jgi:methanogenic corrinoid protein MtbC1